MFREGQAVVKDVIKTANEVKAIGYIYDSVNDVFYMPQPFPSWTISAETNWLWAAPTPMPTDGQQYSWDETNQVWTTDRLF